MEIKKKANRLIHAMIFSILLLCYRQKH